MLREQPQVWGDVASDATAWRAFHEIEITTLVAAALAQVRARLWDRLDRGGEVVIDVDATLVEIHSENKEEAAPHFKGGYGFHPVVATWDTTGEVLAAELRPGNAGANSAAGQLDIVDRAIAQLPETVRRGHGCGDSADMVARSVLVRADSAGVVKGFRHGTAGAERLVLCHGPCQRCRRGAWVTELDAGLVAAGRPLGTRIIVRREHAHPGAQMRLWDHGVWRYRAVLTDQRGDPVTLEAAHRGHAHVEDHVKALRDLGLERMPFTNYQANRLWLFCVVLAQNLTCWFQLLALDPDDPLARATPKTLRYRLFHIGGRLIAHAPKITLRIERTWL